MRDKSVLYMLDMKATKFQTEYSLTNLTSLTRNLEHNLFKNRGAPITIMNGLFSRKVKYVKV